MNNSFDEYLQGEIDWVRNNTWPVRSGWLRRRLVKKLPCSKIHPNPDDEFCNPAIGPNKEIIGRYRKMIQADRYRFRWQMFDEPLLVERIKPKGYMLLNGHHRWAACLQMQQKKAPVKIINLTQITDIQKMARKTRNTKRASLDLDEVVLTGEKGDLSLRKDRLRDGILVLLGQLQARHYDIWLYSAQYYSMSDIRFFFLRFGIRITGIVTGMNPKRREVPEIVRRLDAIMASRYAQTVSIGEHLVMGINRRAWQFRDYDLSGFGESWFSQVDEAIRSFDKDVSNAEQKKMRVSFDLDEVLFVNPDTHKTEPALRFPFNRLYQERLRLGAPELINKLQSYGYEVWVYTSSFRSEKYIRRLFWHYNVHFDGIVNADRHLREVQGKNRTVLPQKLPNRYRISLHVDDESVICSLGSQYGFKTYQLDAQDDDWGKKILRRADQIRKMDR